MSPLVMCALAASASTSERESTLGLAVGLAQTQFRDQQVTPLRHGGIGPEFGLHLDVLTPERLDRTSLTYHFGSSGVWNWHSGEIDTVWAPRVLGDDRSSLYVGVKNDSAFALRIGDNGTWQSNISFGAVVGARKALLERNDHRLWVEGTLSTPLIGVVGRPGFANPFQENSFSLRDWMFASVHNHQALDGSASLLWLRPSGSHLRLELRSLHQRISVRHPVTRARASVNLVAYWRIR